MPSADRNQAMREHYARHLAPLYTWMVGDVAAAMERNRQTLIDAGLGDGVGKRALDLGCGFGLQAIPLADAGYSVVAIDLSEELLGELTRRIGPRPIRPVHADLCSFPEHVERGLEGIVCLGDTLTHLPDRDAVDQLLETTYAFLAPGGRLLLGFRDYFSAEPRGVSRFIPVRSDADRILTCFLEYGVDRVEVTDLVHERSDSGWQSRASTYSKLRLDPNQVSARLESVGFTLERRTIERGMVTVVALRRP